MKVPIVLLACVVALAVAAPATNRGWCATRTSFPKHGRDEGCTMHACDAPATRDGYLVNATSEWLTVRLALHILSSDQGATGVTEEAVRNILALAGETFAKAKIRFALSVRQIYDTNLFLNQQFHGDAAAFMRNLADYSINPTKVLNIFLGVTTFPVPDGYVLGYGTFPWDERAQTESGVLFLTLGGTILDTWTLSHEMGHMFGLWHTHHGVSEIEPPCGQCTEFAKHPSDEVGDLCSDTPPTPLNQLCARPDTHMGNASFDCEGNNWGRTHLENVMGYSHCTSGRTFTPQQMARMRCYLTEKLSGWLAPTCVNSSDCAAADSCSVDECVEGLCVMKPVECPQGGSSCHRSVCSGGQCTPKAVNCTIAHDVCVKGSCANNGTRCEWKTGQCPVKSCCTISGAPLCTTNIHALMCTCTAMPSCCVNQWDETCITLAKQECSLTCPPSTDTPGGCNDPNPPTQLSAGALPIEVDTSSTTFTHKYFLSTSTGMMKLQLCTNDPTLPLSVTLAKGCEDPLWEKFLTPTPTSSKFCASFQFFPLGTRTIIRAGTPARRGAFNIQLLTPSSCSVASDCITDKCHTPKCGNNNKCTEEVPVCDAEGVSGVMAHCFRELGCMRWFDERVPTGWTCMGHMFNDSHCDCNCGVPDVDCAKGQQAAECEVWQKCDTGTCTNRAPASWTCAPQLYGDGACDCGCGANDTDCTNIRIVRNCAAHQTCEHSVCKAMPAGWKCDESYYGTGDGCDCECGAPDPDCELSDMPAVGCKPDHPCTPKGKCTLGPWNCSSANYDADDGCHCLCGSQDPDCLKSGQVVIGCPVPRSICTAEATCIPISDLPSSQIPSEYWSVWSEPASSVLPASAAGHALVSTAALLFALFVALF